MSALRCKTGDLAIIVRSAKFSGLIVRCLEYVGPQPWSVGGTNVSLPTWRIDRTLDRESSAHYPHHKQWVADYVLLPIRDPGSDAKDETLTWLKDKVDA